MCWPQGFSCYVSLSEKGQTFIINQNFWATDVIFYLLYNSQNSLESFIFTKTNRSRRGEARTT